MNFSKSKSDISRETPAERESERAWIDAQWAEIKKLEKGIKVILNSSP